MKFVILALALFAGCQAASLQADAPVPLPTYLEHMRSAMRVYLNQAKVSADAIAEKITDEEIKNTLKQKADEWYTQALALQEQAAPLTNSAISTIDEATRDLRASIHTDIDNLQVELAPMREQLREVVEKHIDEYKTLLTPFLDDYRKEQEKNVAAFKAKLEPVMEQLKVKIQTNVEETKSKLTPILDKIQEKATERMEAVKKMLEPYVLEYKEQVMQGYQQAQSVNMDELRQRLEPHVAALKVNFENLFNQFRAAMGN